jgi:3'(2'), 5'-bisphosphate nucleotidase
MKSCDGFAAVCAPLALAAGKEILRIYSSPSVDVATKADSSPVTEADACAEAVILAGLRDAFPDIPVVAEEEVAAGRVPDTSGCFFLVDPLDGTKEFISRNGEFTVNIALIDDGVPVAGIVYAPALGDIYIGSREDGAAHARVSEGACSDWSPIRCRAAPPILTAVGSRSHGTEETARFLERYNVGSFVSSGSSLKFCLVASGDADIYPRLGRTMEWDTAAGDAVLRAAGGLVTDLEGRPLTYNKRNQAHDTDFANDFFVAYGDQALIGAAKADCRGAA